MKTPLDPETVERIRALGGDELFSELVGLFLVHTPERLKSLRAGVFENDLSRAEKAAHSFRSSSATLGARSAAEKAAVLELMAQRGESEALRKNLPAFEATAASLLEFLGRSFSGSTE
ncbi:MAG: Hpt domain-containing protein [Acidobacteriota bacterium]|nr:Hpt domain-containing protein [Acidobacteriota bacterium]